MNLLEKYGKWFFRNEPTENFSEAPAFHVKSNWNPPKGYPAVEIFLSKLETEIFSVLPGTPLDYNLSKEEWLAMRGLAEDPNIIIKPADKGSCVVVWDQEDYIAEADRQLFFLSFFFFYSCLFLQNNKTIRKLKAYKKSI